jgi:hypothetical protein
VVIALAASALAIAGVMTLIRLGLRAGDRDGEATLLNVTPLTAPRGASVTMSNPGDAAVMVGLSLRPAGARLRLEGRAYVRIRNGSTASELLAGHQASIGVLDARETQTFAVPADPAIGRRAELVAVIGQAQRLRTLHRLVVLAEASGAGTGGAGTRGAPPPGVRHRPAGREGDRRHEQHGRPGPDRERHHMRERERHQAYER